MRPAVSFLKPNSLWLEANNGFLAETAELAEVVATLTTRVKIVLA